MLILKGVFFGLGLFAVFLIIASVLLRSAAVEVGLLKSVGMLAIGCGLGISASGFAIVWLSRIALDHLTRATGQTF